MTQWRQQFVGVLLLALAVWAFLNTPDEHAWQVGISALLGLTALAGATWLIAANFSGPVRIQRLPLVFGCLVLLLALLSLTGRIDLWTPATWLASAITHQRRKPEKPEVMHDWLDRGLFLIRWIALPVLAIPITIRAAGAKPQRFLRLAATYIGLFLLGAVIPHYIIHWVPKIEGLWPELLSAAIRFSVAYAILITAWVKLGQATRRAMPLTEPPA